VDDLATVWCEWAELELRHNQFAAALSLMRRATKQPNMRDIKGKSDAPVQVRVRETSKKCTPPCVDSFLRPSCVCEKKEGLDVRERSELPQYQTYQVQVCELSLSESTRV